MTVRRAASAPSSISASRRSRNKAPANASNDTK
jgi:hypothetical protein